ncbi:hypothetical protein Plhal304r1_c016g0059981 [Plasmopara halstedii]
MRSISAPEVMDLSHAEYRMVVLWLPNSVMVSTGATFVALAITAPRAPSFFQVERVEGSDFYAGSTDYPAGNEELH